MGDLTIVLEQKPVRGMFGSGTAHIVRPVSDILYKRLHIATMKNGLKLTSQIFDELTEFQYRREGSDWTIIVC